MGFGQKPPVCREAIEEDPAEYPAGIDPDTDSDPDPDGDHEQTDCPLPGGDT